MAQQELTPESSGLRLNELKNKLCNNRLDPYSYLLTFFQSDVDHHFVGESFENSADLFRIGLGR